VGLLGGGKKKGRERKGREGGKESAVACVKCSGYLSSFKRVRCSVLGALNKVNKPISQTSQVKYNAMSL
jgi:hypothetical protein